MNHTGGRILRLYKNVGGETIAMDEVTMTGVVIRKNTYIARGYGGDAATMRDWGDWYFHSSNGRKVARETYRTTADRTITEIECIGGWSSLDTVNFDWFEFDAAGSAIRVTMDDLPDVGDTV
jgi:hypothetical protein